MSYPEIRALVHVVWKDAASMNGWNRPGDVEATVRDGLLRCVSVGWVVGLDDEQLLIAQSVNDGNSVAEVTSIPWVVVQSIRFLELRDNALGGIDAHAMLSTSPPPSFVVE